MFVHNWRVDQLSHALFMAAREEDQVVGFKGEGGGGPGKGGLEFGGCGHGFVGFDCRFGCALQEIILAGDAKLGEIVIVCAYE